MIDKYNEMHRGRELLTFSDFCEFESVIKDYVAALRDPAIATLKHVRGKCVLFLIYSIVRQIYNILFPCTSE